MNVLIVCATDRDGRELVRHLAARFGDTAVEMIGLRTARRRPLALQARAAAVDIILTMADAEEETRSLSAEFAEVFSVARGATRA